MQNCLMCENIKAEQWAHGVTAFRCMAELPSPWGNGRVVGTPSRFIPVRIDLPAWCPKNPNYKEKDGAA